MQKVGVVIREARWLLLGALLVVPLKSSRAGILAGSPVQLIQGANIDLSVAGPLDWVHWGLQSETSINRKANVTPQISDFTPLKAVGDTNAGVYVFHFTDNLNTYSWSDGTPTLQANRTSHGVWAYGFPTSIGSGFKIIVPADTSVKTLKVYVGAYAARGRFEAELSDGSAPAYVDTSVHNFRSGPNTVYTLTFAANSPGQTLRIRYTATIPVTDAAGNVTLLAAALNAEGANSPPITALTAPGENSNFDKTNMITLRANAGDLDGFIQKVEFYADTQKLGEDIADPFMWDWTTPPIGHHRLTAIGYDNSGNFSVSAPVDVFVYGSGGSLTGAVTFPAAQVDLTTEGSLDWTHWGTVSSNSFDRKAGVAERISDFAPIGSHPVRRYENNYTHFTWTDGTPTPAAGQTPTGVFMTGDKNGFKLTVPADTVPKRLKVYVGLYGAIGEFRAYLSDMSAPAYSDDSLRERLEDAYGVYTLEYQAANVGEELIIQYRSKELYDFDWGNVTLQSATLTGEADTNQVPYVEIISPTDYAIFFAGSDVHLMADASDSDGSVRRVRFFQNNVLLAEVANPEYAFIWTNPPVGSYVLTAKVTDNHGATITSAPVFIDVRMRPPIEPRFYNPRFEGGGFTFEMTTLPGRIYKVQRNTTLAPTDWQEWLYFVGDGMLQTFTDFDSVTPQFYRALIE